ncbi:DUF371 domain-containing protein [Candidatus Woesearchaeota archaeon]|nr:DUF371 domain-containing protein [Candidatus Woesearchaeota archaeon]
MRFKIFGHKNVLCLHKNTIEFTKEKELTKNGDCILGVSSDFKFDKKILSSKKIKVTITSDGATDSFEADVNPDFDDDKEIVFRKSYFVSKRTLGLNSTKAAIDIDRRIVDKLKDEKNFAKVIIETIL